MRILIVSLLANKTMLKVSDAVPTLGGKINAFYFPYPVVQEILFYPDEDVLRGTGFSDIDVLVYVN